VEVTDDDVRHVADLACIATDDVDIALLTKDLSSILGYVARIRAAGGESAAVPAEPLRLRPDIPEATEPTPLLEAAPELTGRLFSLPLVLG